MKKKRKLLRPAMPGAGRPAVYERPAKVSFLLEQETLDRIDRGAALVGIRRSDALKAGAMLWLEKMGG